MSDVDKFKSLFTEYGFGYVVRSLQADPRIRNPNTIDIIIRKDGVERRIEAQWLKELARLVEHETPDPVGT